jgi:lysophospholipase L1-like esterase
MSSRPSVNVTPPSCKYGIIDQPALTILLEIVGHPIAEQACPLGVLAFGDSITNAGGELQWGVALQSWALWVARGLGLPFTSFALDGALVDDVVHRQIPAFERLSAHPGARYELGCLFIGVNDVRALDWDPERFETDFRQALGFLRGRCDRVLTVTAPLDLGRPRARSKVQDLNAAIERVAEQNGALILDLRNFSARNLVMADRVHPTAFGQIAIAERALDVLEQDGMRVAVRPSALIVYETTSWQRLRGDATYAYRNVKESARALALTVWINLPRPRSRR